MLARLFHRDAVGDGGYRVQLLDFAVRQRLLHAGSACRLHAVHLDARIQRFDGERHAGDESAAAHRHDHRVHIRQLLQHFQTDGALSGDDIFVIERVDKGVAFFLFQLQRFLIRVVIHTFDQTNLRAVAFGRLHLGDRSAVR